VSPGPTAEKTQGQARPPARDILPSGRRQLPLVAEAPSPNVSNLPVYKPFNTVAREGAPEEFYESREDDTIRNRLEDIVKLEQPVLLDVAARRVGNVWGLEKVTKRLRERVRKLIRIDTIRVEQRGDESILWARETDPGAFLEFRVAGDDPDSERSLKEIPLIEIANAVLHVLDAQASLPEDDLIRETAKVFGVNRAGRIVRERVADSLKILEIRGSIQETGGRILLR
jgi:hypothetical protein